SATERAVRLMSAGQKQAFDLSREPGAVRAAYGRPAKAKTPRRGEKALGTESGGFGQGCLMARRLVEAGVPFVEVVMGDGVAWDTHRDNFPRTRALSLECDTAMSASSRTSGRAGCSTRRWSCGWASSVARPSAAAAGATTGPGPGAP